MSFPGAGKKPGLEVWRIEKMEPKPWADVGKFCVGDSYIVLKTTARPGSSSFDWDIHFWLGSETSQDEKGVAAYKTVELDDQLGGAPVQHREVQGHESEKFLSYFKGGVEYVAGGVESGFTKVERDKYDTRLLQCKGKRSVRVTPCAVAAGSLNSGDVFILDCGLTIYQWNGSSSNRKEKAKALDVTTSIKNNERGGRAKVIVHDEGSESDAFWEAIGGKGAVSAATPDNDEKAESSPAKLFRVSNEGGAMKVTEEASGDLKKSMLDSGDVFLVDTGAEVFVWVGKKSNAEEKKNGMVTAQQFLDQQNKPAFTQLTKVIEGGETPLFKEKFSDWSDMRPPTDFSKPPGQAAAKKIEQKEIDVGSLLASASNPADSLVDDGSGKLQVWRIKDFEKEPLPTDIYGNFYAGDSYIVLYTYMQGSKECYMIYFWQGRNSSQDEKGASAILATKLDDELHGAATQVRVVQGKEPAHFLTIFKGSMVVHSGGTASAFKNKADKDSYDTDGVSLYHVKGTNPLNTRAVQVEEKAGSLNSGDAFVLKNPETVYLWYGKGCSADERASAMKLADSMKDGSSGKNVTEVEEGSEPAKFWEYLGGQGEYATSKELVDAPRDPRLFQCSNATGRFDVEEIFEFCQDDLDNSDVFLLDVWTEVYVWVGKSANADEKGKARDMAEKFIAGTGRGEDTPVVVVHSGAEPPMFTAAFLGWDASAAKGFEDPYEKKLRLLREAQGGDSEPSPAAAAPAPAASENYDDPASVSYPLDQLTAKTAPNVDPKQREMYLSDADFQAVFKMDKAAFAALKGWKKDELKKAKGLF